MLVINPDECIDCAYVNQNVPLMQYLPMMKSQKDRKFLKS